MNTRILNIVAVLLLPMGAAFAVANTEISQNLNQNNQWVKVENTDANRVDIVIDAEKIKDFFGALKSAGFTGDYDGYDDVFFNMGWTSASEGFKEYNRLILGLNEPTPDIQRWLNLRGSEFGIVKFQVSSATRSELSHNVEKDKVEDNPNPAKWYNLRSKGQFPIAKNYQNNHNQSIFHLQPNPKSQKRLEVILPLNSSDLNVFISQMQEVFPYIALIESHFGNEYFTISDASVGGTAPVKTYIYPSTRLVFNIDSMPKALHLRLLQVVELYHSYKVPVARIYECGHGCIQ